MVNGERHWITLNYTPDYEKASGKWKEGDYLNCSHDRNLGGRVPT